MPSLQSHLVRLALRYVVAPRFRRAGESVEELREVVARLAKYQKIPAGIDAQPTTLRGMAGEWVQAPEAPDDRIVLFLHGGAGVAGSPTTHRELAARVALAGSARVFVLDYRLAPEHPFPAAVDDAMQAYLALADLGFPPERVAMGGDSSGGGLALQTLISLRDGGYHLPRAAFFLSPQTDWVHFDGESFKTCARKDPLLTERLCRFTASCYAGPGDRSDPRLSPTHMDLSGLPPMLIHAGDCEILLSDAVRLAEVVRGAGVSVTFRVWKGMWHGFHASAGVVPEAREAIRELGVFLRKHLA